MARPTSQPNSAGRKTKRSDAVTKELIKMLQSGNTRMASARAVGIDYSTLKRWCVLSAPFRAALEKAEAVGETLYVGDITMAARSGAWQAAAWWLERRRHDDWRKPIERQEITGKDGEALTVKVLKGVSMDDL